MHVSHPAFYLFHTISPTLREDPASGSSRKQFTWCDLAGMLFTRPSVSEGDFCGACLTGDIKLSDVLQLTRWQSRVCTTMFKRHKKKKKEQKQKTSDGKMNVADYAKVKMNTMDSEINTYNSPSLPRHFSILPPTVSLVSNMKDQPLTEDSSSSKTPVP